MTTEPVVPNLFCNTCGGLFPIPHTCGKDKPIDVLEKADRDPNARPPAAKNLEDMDDQEIAALRSRIAAYDARTESKRKATDLIEQIFHMEQGRDLVLMVQDSITSAEVVKIFERILLEKVLPV